MHHYTIGAIERPTPTTVLLTLKPLPGGRPFSFAPGQYATIGFYRNGRPTPARSFSITASPTDPDHLQFCLRVKGRFTTAVTKLRVGDPAFVLGPFGGFIYDPEQHPRLVMIAGGIGITPFISMIRYASRLRAATQMDLVYSCQDQSDVPFADELYQTADANPNLRVHLTLGAGDKGRFAHRHVATGRISPGLLDRAAAGDYATATFFLCGPPPFMKAMTDLLRAKGVGEDRIVTEAFGQGSRRPFLMRRGWPFNVYPMSFAAVAMSGLVIMASDLIKTLPPFSVTLTGSSAAPASTDQFTQAVNALPPTVTPTPAPAATPAPAPVATPAPVARVATTPAPAAPRPAPVVTPAPAPPPVVVTTPAPPVTGVS